LQHHPTPLAGHRQEKTEKKRVPEELFEKLKANFTEEEIVVILPDNGMKYLSTPMYRRR